MRKKPHFKTAGGRDSTATTNTNRANISVRSACILPRHTDFQMLLSSTMTCDPPRFFRFHYASAALFLIVSDGLCINGVLSSLLRATHAVQRYPLFVRWSPASKERS